MRTEDEAVGQAHVLDDRVVIRLVHEALQRREATDREQLDVAGIAVRALEGVLALGLGSRWRGEEQIGTGGGS